MCFLVMAAEKIMAISFMVLMVMALLAAQVRAVEESNIDGGVKGGLYSCIVECELNCRPETSTSRFAACMALCMIGCEHSPLVAFDYTTGCANSIIKAYNPTDAGKVGSIISSCYKTCNNNN
ncbi:hypothetical protein Gotri_021596 [Gossypium trilobum]|uniref:Thionin-like protein n=1 Tax=Gossypium trilobum TaxID=34281 RepID=A0A7J9DD00_9ROSI|nr:hypothetical protein [Gossypium trilobum]